MKDLNESDSDQEIDEENVTLTQLILSQLLKKLQDDGVSTINASVTDKHNTDAHTIDKRSVRLSSLYLKVIHGC